MRLITILKGCLALAAAIAVTAIAILYSTDFNAYKGDISAFVRENTGRNLEIDGNFEPVIGLTPSLTVDRVRFSNAAWGSRKEMMRIGTLRAELELLPVFFGKVRIKKIVLSGADILLETRPDGTGNWLLETATPEKKAEEPSAEPIIPTFDRILIEESRVTWRDGRIGNTRVVDIGRLTAEAATLEAPLRVTLTGAFDNHPVRLDGKFGSLQKIISGAALPLDLVLSAGGADVLVKGEVKRPAQGKGVVLRLTGSGKDLSRLSGLAGTRLPEIGPYDLSATLSDEGRFWTLKGLKLAMGGSDLTGIVRIDAGAKPVAVVANLSSSLLRELDFRDRTVQGSTERPKNIPAGDGETSNPKRVFSGKPIPMAGLRDINIKLSLRANRIEAFQSTYKDTSIDLAVKEGNLVLQRGKTEFAGGRFSVDLNLDAGGTTPEILFKLDVADLDLAEIAKGAGYPGSLIGRIDARASLSGNGASVRTIMAGLNGTIDVTMTGGRIEKTLFDLLQSDTLDAVSPWLSGETGIEIKCLVGRYGIKKGQLRSAATVFDTDRLLVVGTGGLNLATEEIDFNVNPSARDISLLKLIVPLRVEGTLASPLVLPDPGAIARGAVGVAAGIVTGQTIATVLGQILSGSLEDEQNKACLAALRAKAADATTKGAKDPDDDQPSALQSGATKVLKGIGDGIKAPVEGAGKALKGVGEGLKDLLGR
jgi:uncharacterized protein involved in outer membrane biogenesis